MIGPASLRDALRATVSSAEILDRLSRQMIRIFEVDAEPPHLSGWRLSPDGQAISAEPGGMRLLTADDLARLPEPELRHLFVIERSLQNHFEDWMRVLPTMQASHEPLVAVHCRHLLRTIAVEMVPDVEALSQTLRDSGVDDDMGFGKAGQLIRSVGEGRTPAPWILP